MDISPFAWSLARAVLKYLGKYDQKFKLKLKVVRTKRLDGTENVRQFYKFQPRHKAGTRVHKTCYNTDEEQDDQLFPNKVPIRLASTKTKDEECTRETIGLNRKYEA